MTNENPTIDSPQAPQDAPQERRVSLAQLVLGIVVILVPAGIPLFIALYVEGSLRTGLIALAAVIAVLNTLLVVGIWNWLNSLPSDP